jgi:intein-encoded DNA endonuclease-like protein
MNIPREVTIYAAGFFDGEGNVSTNIRGRQVSIQIGQNNRRPLDYIRGFYGGRVSWVRNKYNGTYVLQMSGINARNFCRDVLPYCLVKDSDIKSAFEYTGHDLENQE